MRSFFKPGEKQTLMSDTDVGEGLEHLEAETEASPETEGEQPSGDEATSLDTEDQPEEKVEETEEDEIATLLSKLEEAQAQANEYLDGWQRARAEFSNYKKRVATEREESRQTSNEALLLKLLPILDDFERALLTLPEELEDVGWVGGVKMILRKLQTLLESERVTPIEAVGEPFDPLFHEAMLQEETSEHPDGHVIEEMQRGYRLGDRVLRASMVKVASNSNQSETENGE
jgi:molecular chaperone GrpE